MSLWKLQDFRKAWENNVLVQVKEAPSFSVKGFSIDTRTLKKGNIFFCIAGPNFDGHKYVQEAFQKGASACVVEKKSPYLKEILDIEITVFVVSSSTLALQNLANYHRKRLSACVIAITGSNGKTSTKEILYSLLKNLTIGTKEDSSLSKQREKITVTLKNLNNHLGLPLSLLEAKLDDKFLILEMGMNHFGEISLLSKIAMPHYAIITSISSAHIEFFGSLEKIAQAKLEIIDGMPKDTSGVLLYHWGSAGVKLARKLCSQNNIQLYFFAEDRKDKKKESLLLKENSQNTKKLEKNIVWAQAVELTFQKGLHFLWEGHKVQCFSIKHKVLVNNLMASLHLLSLLGFSRKDLLQACQDLEMPHLSRFSIYEKKRDNSVQLLVDDSYNANPASFQEALHSLRLLLPQGRLALFMGEMGEQGEWAEESHFQVLRDLVQERYELLILCYVSHSQKMKDFLLPLLKENHIKMKIVMVKNIEELFHSLITSVSLKNFDGILVKGSRSSQMDIIAKKLLDIKYV